VKEKEHKRKTTKQNSAKSSEKPIETRKELARIAGVSHDTIHKVGKIEALADDKTKEMLKKGDITVRDDFTEFCKVCFTYYIHLISYQGISEHPLNDIESYGQAESLLADLRLDKISTFALDCHLLSEVISLFPRRLIWPDTAYH